MKSYHILFLALCISGLFITGCKDKTEPEEEVTFKKETILQNLADNYITPGYQELQLHINALSTSWDAFVATPSQALLEDVQINWFNANISFNKVKVFEIGPAMDITFRSALGTFPADTVQIANNIAAGSYNLTTAANIDAIGFDALDFFFFGTNALSELAGSSAKRAYVTALIQKMKSETDQVVAGWATYKSTFIAGTGTSATSPFSLLINAFCKDFELIKTAKVGIPIGSQSLGVSQPHYLEARRSGFGKDFVQANVWALRAIYLGNGYSSGSGKGFDDYLIALDRTELATTIDNRFASLESQPLVWTGTMESMIDGNKQLLTDYYTYLQASTVYLKTDMTSAFGVLITYQDNDGD